MEQNDQKEEIKTNEEVATENNNTESTETLSESQSEGAQDEVTSLQNEIAQQKDKYLRLYSEFENFRRRTNKEKYEMIQSANEQLIKALLPVIDDFERAEKSFKDKNEKDIEGFFLIHNKFKKTLDQYGVKPMSVGAGTPFNVDIHEAITQIPAPSEELKGKVVDVVEKGYLLNEKVIRFAKVVIGS
jgi:molecular chaperone GrpE